MALALLTSLFSLLAFASACESQNLTSTNIVEQIPWAVPERGEYRVLDDDGEDVGRLDTLIESDADGGLVLRQIFTFPEARFINDAQVVVNPDDLRPRTTSFLITGPEGDLNCDAVYSGSEVTAERVGQDETRTDTLEVPAIAYDSWSDLFLWRTIAFAEDYEVEYTDILSCTLAATQKLGTKLKVAEREEIEVPAGTFETWRLEIESGGADQTAWYSTDDAHRLIRYDNGREAFELTD